MEALTDKPDAGVCLTSMPRCPRALPLGEQPTRSNKNRLAFAAGIVSLCASGIAAARDPAAPYLCMTETQILTCAGEPHSRFKNGAEKETLTYLLFWRRPGTC